MIATGQQSVSSVQPDLFGRIGRERAKPFLKWAGGKSRLLPELRRYVPKRGYVRYIDPFLGGGTFFFDLAPESAILGDSNPELINCYEAVRDEPAKVLDALRVLPSNRKRLLPHQALGTREIDPNCPRALLIYAAIITPPTQRHWFSFCRARRAEQS